MGKGETVDVVGAEKKFRQAEFFLACLENESKEMVHRFGNPHYGGNPEPLEFYLSACLSAAQSVYYILEETGGSKFKEIQRDWRNGLTDDRGRARFGKMMGVRGNDVHLGTTGAEPLPKYIGYDPTERSEDWWFSNHNAALFGPAPVIERENPDGTKVSATVLRGTVGLYLDLHDTRVEATTACRDFLDQLRSLLDTVKIACASTIRR